MQSPVFLSILAASLQLMACGSEAPQDEGSERAEAALATGVPGFLRAQSTPLACAGSISGEFQGSDSAHLYKFIVQKGSAYTFDFVGTHRSRDGVNIAVYALDSGTRLARERRSSDNRATLEWTADRNAEIGVALYAVSSRANGAYQLGTTCESNIGIDLDLRSLRISGDDENVVLSPGFESRVTDYQLELSSYRSAKCTMRVDAQAKSRRARVSVWWKGTEQQGKFNVGERAPVVEVRVEESRATKVLDGRRDPEKSAHRAVGREVATDHGVS